MDFQLGSKDLDSIQERYKKYDVYDHVMLLHRFNLIVKLYKHSKDISEDDLEVLYRMVNMGEENPILTWLASDFIWKKACYDSFLNHSNVRRCSSCKNDRHPSSFMKVDHKTCESCIMRFRRHEKKNRIFYTGHHTK